MAQKVYAFKGVKVEGNKLTVEGPWTSMDRNELVSRNWRICDPQLGARLDDWYAAMANGDDKFSADLSGQGYVRFGCGGVISRVYADGSISVDGHQRLPGSRLRPNCLDARAGMLDWQDDLVEQEPIPCLASTICSELAEEGIFWTLKGKKLKIFEFEAQDQPFSTYNKAIWRISAERALRFFGRQLPADTLPLKLITPSLPIEIHFLGEKPFQALVVDERDTSSVEIVVIFKYEETAPPLCKADTEAYRDNFQHRCIFEVFPATGNADIWLNGDKIGGNTAAELAAIRRPDGKMAANEKWAAVYWDFLCKAHVGIAGGGPLWPELLQPCKVRPDISGVYEILRRQ